jgi:hypothetical protein
MINIDAIMLEDELAIVGRLAIQVLVFPAGLAFGYLGRRLVSRWTRTGFLLAILLAVGSCGATVYRCWEARETTLGRMEGRVRGPYLDSERANNHLGSVWTCGLVSVAILVGTAIGGRLIYRLSRRPPVE